MCTFFKLPFPLPKVTDMVACLTTPRVRFLCRGLKQLFLPMITDAETGFIQSRMDIVDSNL